MKAHISRNVIQNKDSKIISCDKCKYEFLLDAVNIQETDVECEGVKFRLVFFSCPKCKTIYRICLKDDRYDILAIKLEKAKKRIVKANGSGDLVKAEMLDKAVRIALNNLQKHVMQLNSKYTGTFVFDTSTKNNFKDSKIIYLP